ncbi:MAG: type VI secretion system tube protein TssD [Polyangiales bacterium]
MAEAVHLYLKANGMDIQGESTIASLGRDNSIECVALDFAVKTARESGSGMATGRRQYEPLRFRKRIDKSTPLLAKALVENQRIEAAFKFFRPSPAGDGTTQMFFQIELEQGRLASQNLILPDTLVPASSTDPPLEEITVVFHTITWTYTDGGISHRDSWDQNR